MMMHMIIHIIIKDIFDDTYGDVHQTYDHTGVHKSFYPTIRDGSTWSKFRARGENGDVLRFSTEVFSGSPT